MATEAALQEVAKAWCDPRTSSIEMIPELAEVLAEILDEIWHKPWLGNATTAEMLEELKVRAEVGGYDQYRTVGDPQVM